MTRLRSVDPRLVYRGQYLLGSLDEFHEAVDLLVRVDTCRGEVVWTVGPEPSGRPGCQPGYPCRRHQPRRRMTA